MASARIIYNRRRSHSTSGGSSPISHFEPEDSWRSATKRTHHSFIPYPDLSSPQKWDVDLWRQGKRARRNTSPFKDPLDLRRSLDGKTSNYGSGFPSTSADFQIFPNRSRSNTNSRRSFHHLERPSALMEDQGLQNTTDLTVLRSDAFWELHRSIAESGESLVRRMRDYEDQRSRSEVYAKAKEAQRRGRKRASLITRSRKVADPGIRSEDDDVQIFAGELSSGPVRKKRALSLGLMDLDKADPPFVGFDSMSSPGQSSMSGYPSDDEESSYPGSTCGTAQNSAFSPSLQSPPASVAFTPALSQAASDSASSSLISLPLMPSVLPPLHISTTPVPFSPPASRSEKAIAALSLAIANGAGGLNDYSAFQSSFPLPKHEEDESQVGELWH
jgi:hypothetical protein